MAQRRLIDTSEGDAAHRRRLSTHLDAMLALCETVDCRRARLLAYFGQDGAVSRCGNCDTCLSPPESWDGTVAAQKLLSTVVRLRRERGQKFGASQIIDILRGKRTPKVSQYRHDALSVFGVGTDLGEGEWRAVIRQLLAQGLLAVEGDYGTLVTTPASDEVLYRGRTVRMRKDPAGITVRSSRTTTSKGAETQELDAEASAVFERLRAWRASTAKEQGVPAYLIFHDATLRQIATLRPSNRDELSTVSGVGETKLNRYGDEVLGVLAS